MSSKAKYYCQCILHKKMEHGYKELVSWIPDRYAKMNKWLELKNEEGEWEDHWQVIYVGSKTKAELVEAREVDYKKQRGVSDV